MVNLKRIRPHWPLVLVGAAMLTGCASLLDDAPVKNPMPPLPDHVYESTTVETPPRPRIPVLRSHVGQGERFQHGGELSRIHGEALVLFTVQIDGRVKDVTVLQAPNRDVARAAVNIVQQYEYNPAQLDGTPVACRMKMPVRINLRSERRGRPAGASPEPSDLPPPPEP